MNETVMIPEASKLLLKFLEDLNDGVDDRGYHLELAFYVFCILNVVFSYYIYTSLYS